MKKVQLKELNKRGLDPEGYVVALINEVWYYEDTKLWSCRLNDTPHCVGNSNGFWIDNKLQTLVVHLPEAYTHLRPYRWYEVLFKRLKRLLQKYKPWS